MGLAWVRLDVNIPVHDKIVHLLSDPSPKRWQACTVYMFGIAWAGGAGTDGVIPRAALPIIHGNDAVGRLLEKHHLWEPVTTGWKIRNFDHRQELAFVAEMKRAAQKLGGVKGNCIKYHGPDCHCWKNAVGGAA